MGEKENVNLHIAQSGVIEMLKANNVIKSITDTGARIEKLMQNLGKSRKVFLGVQSVTNSMRNYEDIARIFRTANIPKSNLLSKSVVDELMQKHRKVDDAAQVDIVLQSSTSADEAERTLLKIKDGEQKRLDQIRSLLQ